MISVCLPYISNIIYYSKLVYSLAPSSQAFDNKKGNDDKKEGRNKREVS